MRRSSRSFGLREIAAGAIIHPAAAPEKCLWTRVAGDLLDGVLLGRGMLPDNHERGQSLTAAVLIAPVVALGAIYAAEVGWPA